MYADLEENKRLVRFGDLVFDDHHQTVDSSTTTRLTGDSEESYAEDTISVDWLLTRYNLALAQAVLYDATEMRVRVWDSFATVFSYVKLFGLMHRIYPIDNTGTRVESTDLADGYEARLDGAASLFSKSRKYGIRMANFLPALPLCNRWEMEADILDNDNEPSGSTLTFLLDQTKGLSSRTTRTRVISTVMSNEHSLRNGSDLLPSGNSNVRMMSWIWAEVMLPDFAIEHPDGRRVIFEIIGFWTPEYLEEKLAKIRSADRDNLIVAVSERLDCSSEDFGDG